MEALIRDSLMHFFKAFPADLKYCFFSLTGVYNIAQLTECTIFDAFGLVF